jgi:hypothetical protein
VTGQKEPAMPPAPDDDSRFQEFLVTPRYLAGSNASGDAAFTPLTHWPRHHLPDNGECQLLITSPDHRIRAAWYGDWFDPVQISAAEHPLAPPTWTASISAEVPPEIVAGLTETLARDWAEGNDRFLAAPAWGWRPSAQPLLDAGWTRSASSPGTITLLAPDHHAGALIHTRGNTSDDETFTLWAGPPGRRATAAFTTRTPHHLIAALTTAWTDPAPLVRERGCIHPSVEPLVHLTPLHPDTPRPPAPTPLDVRRTAVTAALHRATATRARSTPRIGTIQTPGRTPPPPPPGPPTPGRRR